MSQPPPAGTADAAAPTVHAARCSRAWSRGADWSLRVDVDGALQWATVGGRVQTLAAAGTLGRCRLVTLQVTRGGWLQLQPTPRGLRRLRPVVAAVACTRTGSVPVFLPLDGWSPPPYPSRWDVEQDTAERMLDRSGLRGLLLAAGVQDAYSFDVGATGERVVPTDGLVLDPLAVPPSLAVALRLLALSLPVALLGLLGGLILAATGVGRHLPGAFLVAGTALPLFADIGVCVVRWTRLRHACHRLPGRDLLAELPAPEQLRFHDGALHHVDDRLTVTATEPAGLIARAVVQRGHGLWSLQLLHRRNGRLVIDAWLTGAGWGSRPEVVSRLRQRLGELGAVWTETSVPAGAPAPEPAAVSGVDRAALTPPGLAPAVPAIGWSALVVNAGLGEVFRPDLVLAGLALAVHLALLVVQRQVDAARG